MKAVCWHGKHDVRVETVPDPLIVNPWDAVIKVTRTAICASDLHLYDGYIPTMKPGDILGHEFVGEVVQVGQKNGLQPGDRVVVPFAPVAIVTTAIGSFGRPATIPTRMPQLRRNSTDSALPVSSGTPTC